jgi:hypothetical protein
LSCNDTKQPLSVLIRNGAYLIALLAILWFIGRYVLPIIWALISKI